MGIYSQYLRKLGELYNTKIKQTVYTSLSLLNRPVLNIKESIEIFLLRNRNYNLDLQIKKWEF